MAGAWTVPPATAISRPLVIASQELEGFSSPVNCAGNGVDSVMVLIPILPIPLSNEAVDDVLQNLLTARARLRIDPVPLDRSRNALQIAL